MSHHCRVAVAFSVLAMILTGCAREHSVISPSVLGAKVSRPSAPESWTASVTGGGAGGERIVEKTRWTRRHEKDAPSATPVGSVRADAGAQVIALSEVGHESTSVFNLCLSDTGRFKDGTFTIHFRADGGKSDQGGGPVWRVVDADNYYICRANPLEENFRLYVVKGGKRTQLASVDAKHSTGMWHSIEVTHTGDKIRCVLDGHTSVEATDATFSAEGGVGLWTKADARTSFVVPEAWMGGNVMKHAGEIAPLDTAAIERITGLKGTNFPSEPGAPVFKVTQARTDVPILVEGRKMEPFMGFTSWAAFRPGVKAPAMVAGDLVVFADEVTPVMDAFFAHGCTVTALHNHYLFDQPRVMFLHFGGEGKAEDLAAGFKAGLDAIKAVRAGAPDPASVTGYGAPVVPTTNTISAAPLDAILFGTEPGKGTSKDGMYKAVFGRVVSMSCGCEIGKESGINTWAAFCGSDDNAAVAGDFITFAGELQPVLRALRAGGIHVVTIRNHMEGETPASVFLHYWGNGKAMDLAKTFKAALDAQAAAHARN